MIPSDSPPSPTQAPVLGLLKTLLSCLILFWIACATAHGNAGFFSGYGQDVQLIDSKDVQMISEDILITPSPVTVLTNGKALTQAKADYVCLFKLKNLSTNSLDIQVGFPLDSESFQAPYYNFNHGEVTNDYHFLVLEGSKTYSVSFSREDKEKTLKSIFLWDMSFTNGESKELRITYTMPFSMGVGETAKDPGKSFRYPKTWYQYFETCLTEGFGYVTETGKSWKGKIEHARFRVDLRNEEAFLSQHGMPEGARLTPEMEAILENDQSNLLARMKEHLDKEGLKRFEETDAKMKEERWARQPFENPPFLRNISPTGWKEMPASMVIWETDNYVAGDPLNVSYNFVLCIPQTKDDTEKLIQRTFKGKLTKEDAQDLEDIIRAFYGSKVENPRIAAFLENQKWYPDNTQKKLPPGIIETIEAAKAKE
jgi:hypothetical protein